MTRRRFGYLLASAGASLAARDCFSTEPVRSPNAATGETAEPARLTVRPGDRSDISPYLFGSSIEWVDAGNGICDAATGELRADVIDALRPLRLPVIRFPGGILADYYHWRDGVGPRDARPKRRNPMDGTEHANTFGTDEYIRLLEALSAEGLVTANVGTGTYDELESWRQYFDQRHAPVRCWELGNEIYLAEPRAQASIPGNDARIFQTAATYAAKASDWSARLRTRDHRVLVGGIAGTDNTSGENRGWLPTLLSKAAGDLDFIALHNAFAPLVTGPYDFGDARRREDAYRAMFARAEASAEDCTSVRQQWRAARPASPARIAVSEHFPLFGLGGDQARILRVLDQSRTMASALYTASLFHAWIRAGVWLATYNLTLSKWFGALVTDTDSGLVKTPTYHVFDLYRNTLGTRRMDVTLAGPTFSTVGVGSVAARDHLGAIDAIAALDAQNRTTVAVICRRFEGSIAASIDGPPQALVDVWTLAADSPAAINGPSLTETTHANAGIQPRRSQWTFTPGAQYTFPANSVTMLRWPAA
ncbi:MAG TPA: alpha-L-arabinofuranosidase C-terminal domain-containing protein [Vicinamibacterales bacterium]|nr:alpha-L-arabinofuranosidase C-terminal domain-containing protein [Vicinamibacterales bacterium]